MQSHGAPNTTATAHVPTDDETRVRKSGTLLKIVAGVEIMASSSHAIALKLGFGTDHFATPR